MGMSEAAKQIDLAEEYYTEAEVLAFMGITAKTMSWRRSASPKNVPPYIKLSATRFIYPKADFRKWLEKNKQNVR